MRIKVIILFFFAIWGIVYAAPPKPGEETYCDLMPNCLQISAAMGMQLYSVNTLYEKSEIKYSDPNTSPSLKRTVNISGVVDSLWNQEAYVHDEYKEERLSIGILYKKIDDTDSNSQKTTYADTKRISLKHFKVAPDGDPFMKSVLDSSWIYVPFNLDIHVSDSIVIEGYSALASNYCDSCIYNYHPIAMVIGQYTVFPNKSSAIKNTRARKGNAIKKRNRDAIGKKQKNNTARKIVY